MQRPAPGFSFGIPGPSSRPIDNSQQPFQQQADNSQLHPEYFKQTQDHNHPLPPMSGFPQQPLPSHDQPGPSRWAPEAGVSGLSAMMRNNGTPPNIRSSPLAHPHDFGSMSYYGGTHGSSPYGNSMAMSISPPHWQPGSMGGFGSGSFVGSVGAFGTSFGRQAEGRERELEAKYVRDFTCCGKQLGGLHELLEHYEEEHANMAPDARMAAISAAQGSKNRSLLGDAPTTPGMMDFEMDEPIMAHPWPPAGTPLACVPPSILSYSPSSVQPPKSPLTQEQQQARAARKAAKKVAAKEEDNSDQESGEKRFKCPIEGCGKVYKQANGLKYHLTRSINSGHGNVAAIGGLMALVDAEAEK